MVCVAMIRSRIPRLFALLVTTPDEAETTPLEMEHLELESLPVPESPDVQKVVRPRRRPQETTVSQNDGSARWHFRSVILDRLDQYFVCIKRLRRHDPDAYQLFSRTGFTVSEMFSSGSHPENIERLQAIDEYPSMGGVLLAPDPKAGHVYPSFIYFRKLKSASWVERTDGQLFGVTALYDNYRDLTVPVTCHVAIESSGMRVLKQYNDITTVVQPGRKTHGGRKPEAIRLKYRQWQYPSWLYPEPDDPEPKDPQTRATHLLTMALMTYVDATSRIVVRVKHEGCIAAFGIELSRAKYFFRDREAMTALARDGKRKRIFHSVSAHSRKLGDDRTTEVRRHYRGLRSFDWNGYGIHIVYPDNAEIMQMPIPAIPEIDLPIAERLHMIGSKDTGEKLAELLEQ